MRTLLTCIFLLMMASLALAQDCPLLGQTFHFELEGSSYLLSDFQPDGFGPGLNGNMLLTGPDVSVWVPASCTADGRVFVAGFPCEVSDSGLRCFLKRIDDLECYEIFGEKYCFEGEIPVLDLKTLEEEGE